MLGDSAHDTEAPIPGFEREYELLRRLAGELMQREPADHVLQPTALVHEAYMRLAGNGSEKPIDRNHFFALASRVMRRVLVDTARRRRAAKRGGGAFLVSLDRATVGVEDHGLDLLGVDEMLDKLSRAHPRPGRVTELRLFSGLAAGEIAELLGVSERTVDLDWRLARAWLAERLGDGS
ncbi:MAG: extracytoplasmic sigma factor ECF [Phycisphaeraceae bacterium]|nr:MAG: extracytoplasmic sigma factor ECF [Phycisphaeraceae bacterium]